jgi:DNA-binding NtrC family response regulator
MLEMRNLGLNVFKAVSNLTSESAKDQKDLAMANAGSEVRALAEIERRHILNTLQHCQGNRTHAARLLEVSIRTLRNKLHEYKDVLPSGGESAGLSFA